MKIIILELTYSDEVSADTLLALLDSHSEDEGLVHLKGRIVTTELEMSTNKEVEPNDGMDEKPFIHHYLWGRTRTYCGLELMADMKTARPGQHADDQIVCGDCVNAMEQMP